MAESDARYYPLRIPVAQAGTGRPVGIGHTTLDVCNSCGSIVGNRPAHDVLCATDGVPKFCGDWPAPCNCDDPTTHTGRH